MTSKPALPSQAAEPTAPQLPRRRLLSGLAAFAAGGMLAKSGNADTTTPVIRGEMPWAPGLADAPMPVKQGGLAFFTVDEAKLVGAIADRLIPADELSIGAVEAGCVLFIDRQLAGDFGKAAALYRRGRFVDGTPQQGPQFRETPAERYRSGPAAFDKHVRSVHGKSFVELDGAQQDMLLGALETGKLALPGIDGIALFGLLLQNTREGFFSDPMYGGNKDMAGWKMIGFPGARYDYRDVVDKRGKKLSIIPISMADRSA
jgi:gluconate 2-dehydrogenase gamma chain